MFLRKSVLGLAMIVSAMTPALAQNQIPRTISFQGVLANAGGVIVPDGIVQLSVSFHARPPSTTLIFLQSLTVPVVRGVFNAIIVSQTTAAILAALAFVLQYYLGVAEQTESEIQPRTPSTGFPYALNSLMAQ